ncbi:P-loop containing nucleoside triphosphate hydrolase protein [Pholiota molesta]|nr:P-loop containing nucleoside triphosphate hydrolase protein [Pholiota molesta]
MSASDSETSKRVKRAERASSSDSPESGGLGLSNAQLSHGRRRMLDVVNKLHSTGVQVDIDLPQIAVIGSQSSGKSSLIESISGIKLPRASGTCTRCPLECRLSRSDKPWQCIVSLRFITDADGQPLGQARNEQFGDIIVDTNEIEDRIRRAQSAILNPKTSAKKFLAGDADKRPAQLSFSLNAITLQISGPDVADLSFCDLPGLIASVSSSGGSQPDDIALVENLATTYIKKRNCIILLTVACETDFENQGAHRLAKKYDPKGTRTIGVLTKPDRIPIGEESNWLPFICGEKERLKHNWFCVKQPSSNDLKSDLTWFGVRKMENDFFASKAPWSELDGAYQPYLRTRNLVDRLSSVLSALISKRLPPIQEEVKKSIRATRDLLAELPRPPPAEPRSAITTLLHTFTSDLSRHVEGIQDDMSSAFGEGIGLIQAIRPAQERFRMMVRATEPNFQPFERSEGKKHLGPASFLGNEGDEEENDEEDGDEEEGQAREGHEETEENEDEYQGDEDVHGGESEEEEAEEDEKIPRLIESLHSGPSAGTQIIGKKRKRPHSNIIYVDEVLERAHRARTRELPGSFPFVVQKTFINNITKEWSDPAYMLCETVHATVLEQIKSLVCKHFSEFGQGSLERNVQSIMERHMRKCQEQAEERIKWLLELEDSPFSMNTHYLADYKAKFLAHYKGARDQDYSTEWANAIQKYENKPDAASGRKVIAEATGIAKILSGFAEMGVIVKPEDLAKVLPPDPMEPVLVIMADVRAYFQVAYKRFVDNVPLAVDRELVRGAAKDTLSILCKDLGINGVDGERICRDFAGEGHEVAARRADLQKKLERLETASEELHTIRI